MSSTQMSGGLSRLKATNLPSGESAGPPAGATAANDPNARNAAYWPSGPATPSCFPIRSNQASWTSGNARILIFLDPTGREYARLLVAEIENGPVTAEAAATNGSATGNAPPEVSNRFRSND